MRKSGKGAGGGIGMNKNVSPGVRTGMRAREINPRGVSQIGSSMGNHATDRSKTLRGAVEPVRGALKPSGKPGGIELGNSVALNVGKGGVGTGRNLYGQCGSQQQYGPLSGSTKPQGRSFDEPPPNSKRE
jgi:hypothetical protein